MSTTPHTLHLTTEEVDDIITSLNMRELKLFNMGNKYTAQRISKLIERVEAEAGIAKASS